MLYVTVAAIASLVGMAVGVGMIQHRPVTALSGVEGAMIADFQQLQMVRVQAALHLALVVDIVCRRHRLATDSFVEQAVQAERTLPAAYLAILTIERRVAVDRRD